MDLAPVRQHYRKAHNLCIVCLKPWYSGNRKICECEEKHWEKEREEKLQVIANIGEHLKTLKVELRKQKYKFKEGDTTTIIVRLSNNDQLELERKTVKEIKHMMLTLKERDDCLAVPASSDDEEEVIVRDGKFTTRAEAMDESGARTAGGERTGDGKLREKATQQLKTAILML